MSFTKVSEKITTPEKFASVVRNYLVASGYFTPHTSFSDTYFSVKHKNGKWFVLEFTGASINCFLSFNEPTQAINRTLSSTLGGMYKVTYPLLNLYLTTTKTFIAISAEIRSSVFRHMLIGRMESYANRPDGEFVYSTNSTYDNIGYKSFSAGQDYSYFQNQKSFEYYYGNTIVGMAYSPYSGFKNYVAYNGKLINSCAGGGIIEEKLISAPPANIANGSMNFNGRSPLNIHYLMYSPKESTSFLTPVFYCNELATIAIDNLSAGNVVLEDWIVFPVVSKLTTVASDEISTGSIGVAFKFK